MTASAAQLIGIDWGTSALRAYLLGAGGTIVERRALPWGVMSPAGRDFAGAFATIAGDWQRSNPALPAIAAGMVGSTEGWVHAPYCDCPAGESDIAARLATVTLSSGATLHVVPGVACAGDAPSVMRGEETQIVGAVATRLGRTGDAVVILPGTHAKWVELSGGCIMRFETYLTGELYAVLSDASILGRPARTAPPGEPADAEQADAAFAAGVRRARDSAPRGLAPLLFLARSLVLTGGIAARDSLDFLSGLIVGDEIRSGLGKYAAPAALIGEVALSARYSRALALFDRPNVTCLTDTAPAGLWRIAAHAGLVRATTAGEG